MAPSSFAKHRFQNSLDLAAARSMRNVGRNVQSGTGNAWCIVDSPTLGRMSSVSRCTEERQPAASGSWLAAPIADTAPLNVKKIRRRGLVSGVHLVLPPSPLPLGSTLAVPTPRTASTPGTALTFTAEWDLTQKTFVFTPFESEHPQSSISPKFVLSPVPDNVEDDYFPRSPPAPTTPSVYSTYAPSRSSMQALISPAAFRRSWSGDIAVVTDGPTPSGLGDASSSEPSTPVSAIFDSPDAFSHGRKLSHSTAASSVTDLSLPDAEKPAPPSQAGDDGADNVVYIFDQALHRAAPAPELSETYRELDRDLVVAPMDVFEQTLWEATLPDVRAMRRATKKQPPLTPQRRPLVDAPSSAFSVYSLESSSSSSGGSPSSSKGSLRQQISKALSSTLHFKR
ncbi:hypothetical protein PHLGIDRAFT_117033 [Phlebiopsis gigantea 11061_1 CR5-6]|uniref:Uncharacterized protein n=1 Tax=Phlebiopsis gigantea (strain 11061_1 CR5-6) TaxID=745531 RepID=A0A0C3S0X2_PHLG1|nr:hypothetical protein PHLGIDRAFT_117033 [Phlebiopsis gigantea 11061_1 CR5-6]